MNYVTKTLLGAAIATLFLVAVVACHGASASTESESRNIAIDTVRYVETGATCEAGFAQPQLHSARCTLPGGVKIYCTASAAGWACSGLSSSSAPPGAPVPPHAPPPGSRP